MSVRLSKPITSVVPKRSFVADVVTLSTGWCSVKHSSKQNRPNIPQGTWLWYPANWLMAAIPDHVNFYIELWSTTISVWILTLIVLSRHPRAFNASFQIISSSTVLILRLYGFFKDLHVIWRKVTNLSWRKGEWCRAKYAHKPVHTNPVWKGPNSSCLYNFKSVKHRKYRRWT